MWWRHENVLHRKDSADKTAFNWSSFSSWSSQRRGQMCVSMSALPHWKQTSLWPAWLMSRSSRWASTSPRLSSSNARADGSLTNGTNDLNWKSVKGVSGKSQRLCSMCQSPFTPNDEEHWRNWSVRQLRYTSNARTQATTCVQIQL